MNTHLCQDWKEPFPLVDWTGVRDFCPSNPTRSSAWVITLALSFCSSRSPTCRGSTLGPACLSWGLCRCPLLLWCKMAPNPVAKWTTTSRPIGERGIIDYKCTFFHCTVTLCYKENPRLNKHSKSIKIAQECIMTKIRQGKEQKAPT